MGDALMFFAVLASYSATEMVEINQFIDGCVQMRGAASGIDVQILRCQANHIAKQVQGMKKDIAKVMELLSLRTTSNLSPRQTEPNHEQLHKALAVESSPEALSPRVKSHGF